MNALPVASWLSAGVHNIPQPLSWKVTSDANFHESLRTVIVTGSVFHDPFCMESKLRRLGFFAWMSSELAIASKRSAEAVKLFHHLVDIARDFLHTKRDGEGGRIGMTSRPAQCFHESMISA